MRLHLGAMPYSGIPGLAASWGIARLADRPNGGLLVGSWHHYRGPDFIEAFDRRQRGRWKVSTTRSLPFGYPSPFGV